MLTSRKTGAYVNPDQPWVGVVAISLVMVIMAASMTFSFTSITEAAAWTGNPLWTHFLAAVFIDGAIIAYTAVRAVGRWRGNPKIRTLLFLWLFTLISVLLNFGHTASTWDWDWSQIEAWYGILIATSAPIAALLSAEEVMRMTFEPAQDIGVATRSEEVASHALDSEREVVEPSIAQPPQEFVAPDLAQPAAEVEPWVGPDTIELDHLDIWERT